MFSILNDNLVNLMLQLSGEGREEVSSADFTQIDIKVILYSV